MERRFAGILGTLAFAIVAARAAWYGEDLFEASRIAIFSMAAFAGFGYIVGLIARRIVAEAERDRRIAAGAESATVEKTDKR